MRPATEVLKDDMWKGLPCAIVGGGPSLRGFDFDRLHGMKTIGINAALRIRPDLWYGADDWYIEQLLLTSEWDHPGTIKLVPEIVHHRQKDYPDTYWLKNAPKGTAWGNSLEVGLASMGCSGVSALNLADVLGACPIVLLGFDAQPGSDSKLQHWHDEYPLEYRSDARWAIRFQAQFRRHAVYCRSKVLNACPNSGIEIFPRMTIDEALAEV